MENKRQFIVTLVRHGETMSNRFKIMQGQLDTQLSDMGEEQARLAGKRLKDQRFTHVFSSDLARAANTARKILAENTNTTCNLTLDQRLRERGFGHLEGRPFTDYKKAQEESGVSHEMFTPEGGETIDQVYHRAKDFFRDLCKLMAEPVKPHSVSDEKDASPSDGEFPPSPSGSESQLTQQKKTHSHGGALTDTSNLIDLSPKTCPTASTSGSSSGIHIAPSSSVASSASASESKADIDHVLIVSHGLLLRELKRVILEKFKGVLEGPMAQEALAVSPNTGVTSVTMSVNYKYNKIKSQCIECHCFNCAAHLRGSNTNLISQALFKGAL
ncbi:fructose-2,6-bisphosphatase TIGAR [Elysia marginata]|uniref:Fructose-2,6-bisphosphatase TIGAR n=1 Tax=Elysia marginata TaxID=1093978 RepID=A0AAV4JAG7_9GAST|nr:fructose-2,6-bisphosphatase TIGAR [Elysia marginata]